MNRIFISHSSEDRAEAKALSEAFDEVDISYWLDEQSLPLGGDVSAEISRAIDNSNAVVFLLSKNSNEKTWQSAEIALALSKGKKVFPLVLTKDLKVPILLQQYVYLDVSEDRDFRKVALLLAKALEQKEPEIDVTTLRLDTLHAKRMLIKRQKEIYMVASTLKEREMKSQNFSLLLVSLCISTILGLLAFIDGMDYLNVAWSLAGVALGVTVAQFGHIYRKRTETKESGKEVQR
jgi:hypothetical protein